MISKVPQAIELYLDTNIGMSATLKSTLEKQLHTSHSKVRGPNSMPYLDQTAILGCVVIKCGSKNRHQKDVCLRRLDYMLRIC